ncbi:uncharacterized protein EKO05_0001858 [Ascochyta rabiei]|uniref:Uncharacterized protein n=1 Tax=Didymella rabiei TaxID=5454 RepID=A0A163I1P2_DIDRA|nr:uncharacterized protein EKO05_0001858 [Ascochyta rabiei]KZM25563.1 hypothetical protein ST47_g3243 [Ascochyta rabiei]UPX11240.1 hypothetical protein EKO05_0001858 [Ascochyta rabiei]
MDGLTFFNLTSTIMAAIASYRPPHNTIAISLATRQVSGTGPYAPKTTSSPLLPSHTIYQPSNLSGATESTPVIIWGNNACTSTASDPYKDLNEELASWGAMVFACGPSAPVLSLLESHASFENIDTAKLGMLGTSCESSALYAAAENPLVLSLAVLDVKPAVSSAETRALAANATKPVFWFSAGAAGFAPLDRNRGGARADFDAVARGVPAWYGALPGADGEVLDEGSAGKMGRAGRFWAQWMVEGNQTASGFFVDAAGAESEGWTVARKGMDVLVL